MKIVTRGYGQNNLIVTRGYGLSISEFIYREVIKLTTSFGYTLRQTTSFSAVVGLTTIFSNRLKLHIGGIMGQIKLSTSFSRLIKTSNLFQFGRLTLSGIFKVAGKIKLFCRFYLRRR